MPQHGNPYLSGLFAPVRDEITTYDLEVTGRIPEELDGRYLRNGPNPLRVDDPEAYHWFTGEGMVHGVRLRDGRAQWYRNRWVRSDSVAQRLGEKIQHGPRHLDMDVAPNTHITRFAGRNLALVEGGPLPYELDDDLNTVGPYDFAGTLPGGLAAHTTIDPATGELHCVAYCWAWPYVQYLVAGTNGRIRRHVDIPVSGRPMMHDFSLTARHVLLYDLPVVLSPERAGHRGAFPYAWDPDRPARLGILPRAGGAQDVRWLEIEPCFVFHPMNAYESQDGTQITVDLIRYEKIFDEGHSGPDECPPALDRWTVDLIAGRVRREPLDDRPVEFPRVDPRRLAGRHRYGYGVVEPGNGYGETLMREHGGASGHGGAAASVGRIGVGLVKYDLERGTSEVRRFDPRGDVGEAVFVPTGPETAEDDGWLMTYVFDPEREATDLVILSARDITGPPVARVHLPVRVPVGFHGNWLPERE
ncbi:carotenoid oxygenase family protein [Streptomyces sp. NPDC003077]|uniref:carotenoid oxygenase family protein n=1 Tax=Streptomyces sp. NPDC003077 TaxID=3154443 RepID=UPI0033BDC877